MTEKNRAKGGVGLFILEQKDLGGSICCLLLPKGVLES